MTHGSLATAPSGLMSELVFRPLPYEVDFTGFVSNTVAPRWMEALRVYLMEEHFPHFDNGAPEHLSVIAETRVKYVKPIRYGDLIHGRAWITSASHSRWIVAFTFKRDGSGEEVLRGEQTGAFISARTFAPIRIPAEIRRSLTPFAFP
jgi:acyl-CoA thioester hydrolase